MWIPEYDLDQEQSKTAAAYAGFQEFGNECCFLMLRPTFDESPVSIGESGGLNMPRASPMSSMSQNSEQNWVSWSAMMRAVLVRAIPGSITRYGSDPDGRQYTQEQVDAVRGQLNMRHGQCMKCFICWKLCRRCLPSELPARLHMEPCHRQSTCLPRMRFT